MKHYFIVAPTRQYFYQHLVDKFNKHNVGWYSFEISQCRFILNDTIWTFVDRVEKLRGVSGRVIFIGDCSGLPDYLDLLQQAKIVNFFP